MRIADVYSHLNGLEYLLVHKKELWAEIQDAVLAVDAHALEKKVSKEIRMKGRELFAPKEMNRAIKKQFISRGWKESRTSYWDIG